MAGLVPLLSGLTSGRALCRQTGPSPPPSCHPGLDPGSREAARRRCLTGWTPDRVRGDSGGYGARGASVPQSEPRPDPSRRAIRISAEGNAAGLAPAHMEDTIVHATAIVTDPAVTRSGSPTALLVTEGFRDAHRRDMPTHGSNVPTPRSPRADGRHLPTAMSTGGPSQQRSTFPARHPRDDECRVGSDLPTRCLCRRRAGMALAGVTVGVENRSGGWGRNRAWDDSRGLAADLDAESETRKSALVSGSLETNLS